MLGFILFRLVLGVILLGFAVCFWVVIVYLFVDYNSTVSFKLK